jgi:hypothetical protein
MWTALREELREGLWLVSAVGGISLLTVVLVAMLAAIGAGHA